MANWTDILGAGKGFTKLLDVFQIGTGRIFQSTFHKKDTDADLYRLLKLSEGIEEASKRVGQIEYNKDGITIKSREEGKKQLIQSLPDTKIVDRGMQRHAYQVTKAQFNLEEVTRVAADQLSQEDDISDEPVDEDWINKFFKIVEDVSNEEMQKLWGRILASEIQRPKSFSLRTLELLKNLNAEEAALIERVGKFAGFSNTFFLFKEPLQKFDITYENIALLKELSIIISADAETFKVRYSGREESSFAFGKTAIVVCPKEGAHSLFDIPIYAFTKIGSEILRLIDVRPPKSYIDEFVKFCVFNESDVYFSELIDYDIDMVRYIEPLKKYEL